MVSDEMNSNSQWVTLKEASEITGRTINSLRLLISRKKVNKIKKVKSSGQGYWLIHKDSLKGIMLNSSPDVMNQVSPSDMMSQINSFDMMNQTSRMITLPADFYERQQKEWFQERDQLQAGLLMYRYKYEETERRMKLLPAPAETIASKLTELEGALGAEVEHREKLTSALQEERAARANLEAELRQARLPWWKRLLKKS